MTRTLLLTALLAATGGLAGGLLARDDPRPQAKAEVPAGPSRNPPAATAVDPRPTASATQGSPASSIDSAVAQARWPDWLERPARDPFQLAPPAPQRQAETETPISRFRLFAIWLQTGGRLAVIDRGVYAEGDRLADYRILRIDAEGVVVQGADRTDTITFTSHVPTRQVPSGSGTNLIEQWLGPEKEKLF